MVADGVHHDMCAERKLVNFIYKTPLFFSRKSLQPDKNKVVKPNTTKKASHSYSKMMVKYMGYEKKRK